MKIIFLTLEILTLILIPVGEFFLAKFEKETPIHIHVIYWGIGLLIALLWDVLRRLESLDSSSNNSFIELNTSIERNERLTKMLKEIEESKDEARGRHKERLINRLALLAKNGEIRLYRRDEVYDEDSNLINALPSDSVFSATVLTAQNPREQFIENADFRRFIQAQFAACDRRVTIERFYIFDTEKELENIDVTLHLDKLLENIRDKDIQNYFFVYVLILENVSDRHKERFREDLVAFGNARVSKGTQNDLAQSDFFARYTCEPEIVREVLGTFRSICGLAILYSDWKNKENSSEKY